jgi:ParB family chromosome partitioning protein
METQVINAPEYRTHGVLSSLLVRPLTENGFEIVAGARRFRAAQIAGADTVPVRIVELSDPRHSKPNASNYL